MCSLCNNACEDVDHFLIHCPYAYECWNSIRSKLGWIGPLPKSVMVTFQCWPLPMTKTTLASI